ncbi:MAG: sigma-70 family RNA polymerase sigma factor [Bacteroidales bacterium]|nr:sigma-70 family RNA polymerase sigma factor [Bacteroidales bacterium]
MQRFGEKLHLNNQDNRRKEPSSERELLEACKRGDRTAQKKLYDSLAAKMFAICLRYMGQRDAAEDVLQEGFITLFSRLDSYSGEGSFEGWARKIFVNTALMELRKKDALKMSEDLETAWNVSSDGVSQVQSVGYHELLKLIASLPPGYRTVFNLSVIEGYSHKEIAQTLGITEVTSRSQLQRARVMLQEKIKKL